MRGLLRLNGIESIHQQVEDDLLDLNAIPHDRLDDISQIDAKRDLAGKRRPVNELCDITDDGVQIHQLELRIALLEERSYPLQHLAGAAVVVTPHGCTREYFGNLALYARPDRPREIARAVRGAWEIGPSPALRERIGARFLWSEVARRTAEVYDEVAR